MTHLLLFADTEDYEVTAQKYPNMDEAYHAMEESYNEQAEYYDSCVVDNGIEDDKAFLELDDGRHLFWNIK